jgi:hypothetical protein
MTRNVSRTSLVLDEQLLALLTDLQLRDLEERRCKVASNTTDPGSGMTCCWIFLYFYVDEGIRERLCGHTTGTQQVQVPGSTTCLERQSDVVQQY